MKIDSKEDRTKPEFKEMILTDFTKNQPRTKFDTEWGLICKISYKSLNLKQIKLIRLDCKDTIY